MKINGKESEIINGSFHSMEVFLGVCSISLNMNNEINCYIVSLMDAAAIFIQYFHLVPNSTHLTLVKYR